MRFSWFFCLAAFSSAIMIYIVGAELPISMKLPFPRRFALPDHKRNFTTLKNDRNNVVNEFYGRHVICIAL